MTTLDAHLLALDMKTGAVVWDATLEDYKNGYASTIAPLVVKDKVIVGVAGGEYGIRGFIDAYDAQTGKRAWRFYTIPGPGEPGNDTWAGDSWKSGGAGVWVTGAYDPELNLRLLRHRQSGSRLPQREPRGRQPLQRLARRARRRHRQAALALPVHAARRARLGLDAGADPRRHHDRRAAAQGRDVRQPQRLLLHARSHDRQGDRRQAVRADDVGEGDRTPTAGRCCCPATCPTRRAQLTCPDITGGTNFWPPSYDPSTQTVLRQRARSLRDVLRVEAGVHAGRAVHRRRRRSVHAAATSRPTARCARSIRRPASAKWEFRYLNPSTVGPADDGVGPDLQRRRRRQPAGARLAQRQAAVALPDGRDAARHVADHLHARRTSARARAGGHDADRVGVTELGLALVAQDFSPAGVPRAGQV